MKKRFPIVRLVTLLAQQAYEPLAARIKDYAIANSWFRQHVCLAAGRAFHELEQRATRWTLELQQPHVVQPLSEQAAIDCGSMIIGKVIVFILGSLIIFFEVNRKGSKQDKVRENKSQRLSALTQLEELQRELVLQQLDIDRLMAELRRIAPNEFPPGPPTE